MKRRESFLIVQISGLFAGGRIRHVRRIYDRHYAGILLRHALSDS